jgi:hypothetical protein
MLNLYLCNGMFLASTLRPLAEVITRATTSAMPTIAKRSLDTEDMGYETN